MISVFLLVRDEDETGVSGEGVVAAGMEFPDGHVVMRWLVGEHKSSVCWESMHAVEKIHGHNGKTRIVRVGKLNPMGPEPKLNVRDAYEAHIKSYGNLIFDNERRRAKFLPIVDERHVWKDNKWKPLSEREENRKYFATSTDTGAKPLTLEWLNDACKKIAIESAKRLEQEVMWGNRNTPFGKLGTTKNETRIPVVSSLSPT